MLKLSKYHNQVKENHERLQPDNKIYVSQNQVKYTFYVFIRAGVVIFEAINLIKRGVVIAERIAIKTTAEKMLLFIT
ncbi:MAG: hypothetical protein E3J78_00960, partial [Candidatus Cloacimonadota bacterium]